MTDTPTFTEVLSRAIPADGTTIDQMRAALWDTPAGRTMINNGDVVLYWLNEADVTRAALAAAPQPATPGQRMIRAAEEAVAIARGEAEPASVYPAAEHDWGKPVGKEVLPPYQQDREALVEVIREAIQPSIISDVIPALAADALLARGLRLPGGDETMAWAVVGEDGEVIPGSIYPTRDEAERVCDYEGERIVQVTIRVVEGGDDAA